MFTVQPDPNDPSSTKTIGEIVDCGDATSGNPGIADVEM
jgi:hypothetical protein